MPAAAAARRRRPRRLEGASCLYGGHGVVFPHPFSFLWRIHIGTEHGGAKWQCRMAARPSSIRSLPTWHGRLQPRRRPRRATRLPRRLQFGLLRGLELRQRLDLAMGG
jgi:hypothetical protein